MKVSVSSRMIGMSLAVCSAVVTTSLPTFAQEVEINPESVSLKVDLAARQRMLGQRMAKFFCLARTGVHVMENVKGLVEAKDLFEATHRGLAHGDKAVGLFDEGDESVIKAWRDVDLMWSPLKDVYEGALEGATISEEKFYQSMQLSDEIVRRNNLMVAQIRGAYADKIGEGGLGAAVLVDLYERQSMLSQELAKEVCLIARGDHVDEVRAELHEAIELFESSLIAFIEGLPIAGIPAAPTPEIAAKLEEARTIWAPVRSIASNVADGSGASLGDLAKFSDTMEEFLPVMEEAVEMLVDYESHLKG